MMAPRGAPGPETHVLSGNEGHGVEDPQALVFESELDLEGVFDTLPTPGPAGGGAAGARCRPSLDRGASDPPSAAPDGAAGGSAGGVDGQVEAGSASLPPSPFRPPGVGRATSWSGIRKPGPGSGGGGSGGGRGPRWGGSGDGPVWGAFRRAMRWRPRGLDQPLGTPLTPAGRTALDRSVSRAIGVIVHSGPPRSPSLGPDVSGELARLARTWASHVTFEGKLWAVDLDPPG